LSSFFKACGALAISSADSSSSQTGELRHPMAAGQRHRADDRVLDALQRRIGQDHRKPIAELQLRRPEEMVGHDAVAALSQLGVKRPMRTGPPGG